MDAVIMIGAPGSGKSTIVESLYSDYKVLSRDIIRSDMGLCKPGEKFKGDAEQEKAVHNEWLSRLNDLIKKDFQFIIDDTNCVHKYLVEELNMIKTLAARYHKTINSIEVVRVITPVEVLIKNRPQIPAKDLQRMFQSAVSLNLEKIVKVKPIFPDAKITNIHTKYWKENR